MYAATHNCWNWTEYLHKKVTRFSIIIPVYNVEPYLHECLDSVLHQTFKEWEAICVNDGSTDGSLMILEDYATKDNRFKVVNQENGGLSAARNTGMDHSTGEYVLFLDSDDWLEHSALETIDAVIAGEDMVCFSGRRYFDETKKFNHPDALACKSYTSGMDYYSENALLPHDFAFVCVVLRAYRRKFLIEKGLRFKEGIYHEDNLFTPPACYHAGHVRQIPDCLYNYRVRANSITDSHHAKRMRDFLYIANELASFFIPKSGFDKAIVYRAITHHYQVVFQKATKEDKELRRLCNWRLYRAVSRTKLRHRINYIRNRFK